MKRCILLAAALAVFLASCAPSASPLSYQNGIKSAVCLFELRGVEFKTAIFPMEQRLAVLSPECVAGAEIQCVDGRTYLGDAELPDVAAANLLPILHAFSLPDDGAKLSTSASDRRQIKVSANGGSYTVTLAPDGSPETITFKGAVETKLKIVEVKK